MAVEDTRAVLAAAFRARMVAEAMNDDDHLPPAQEDDCFRQRIHTVLTGPGTFQVMADVDRFVELAMEVVYERAFVMGQAIGYTEAMSKASKKVKRD